MKDYMLIFIGPEYGALGLSPEEMQQRMGKWFAWIDKLNQKGVYKSGEALHAPSKRVTSADGALVDGPSAESKELVGGYFIVQAESFEQAVSYTKDFPDYDVNGVVEVREVILFE